MGFWLTPSRQPQAFFLLQHLRGAEDGEPKRGSPKLANDKTQACRTSSFLLVWTNSFRTNWDFFLGLSAAEIAQGKTMTTRWRMCLDCYNVVVVCAIQFVICDAIARLNMPQLSSGHALHEWAPLQWLPTLLADPIQPRVTTLAVCHHCGRLCEKKNHTSSFHDTIRHVQRNLNCSSYILSDFVAAFRTATVLYKIH